MTPALLVIDVQNEYFAPHGQWALPEGERALIQIQALLAAARDTGTPVIYVTHERLGATSGVFVPGSIGAQMHPAIDVRPGEAVLRKHFPGAFTQTPLEAHLRHAGADTIIVSGFMTHLCCDTTSRQASERGYPVLFASDATATRDLTVNGVTVSHASIQQSELAVMTNFATVLTAEEIARRLCDQ
jgi:nicotinamidase-related amidase